jgi:hypothetical protein
LLGWPSIWNRRLHRPPAANPGALGEQPAPCLALLRAGVTWPRKLLPAPVSSYLTFSPSRPLALPPSPSGEGLGERSHCVSVARSVRLPLPGCYPAPCSVECGLSSGAQRVPAAIRPAWGISSYHKTPYPESLMPTRRYDPRSNRSNDFNRYLSLRGLVLFQPEAISRYAWGFHHLETRKQNPSPGLGEG